MKAMSLMIAGAAVCACGGMLVFTSRPLLPLWLVWMVGPLCWYLGIAAVLFGACRWGCFFRAARRAAPPQPSEEHVTVIEFRRLVPGCFGPRGITREIPPMGAFVV